MGLISYFHHLKSMGIIIKTRLLKKKVAAIALFPFILVNRKAVVNEQLINHERIHLRQQIEMLVLPFYLFYLLEYLVRLIQTSNKDKAYRNISFEREAYENDHDMNYLQKRKIWNWIKYLK